MATRYNYVLGRWAFDTMEQPPQSMTERTQLIERPGVDGAGVRLLGKGAKPFRIRTERFMASNAAALTLFDQYHATIEDGPQGLMWRDSIPRFKFQVLDISLVGIQDVAGVAGSIVASPTVCLICMWTLVQVPSVIGEV